METRKITIISTKGQTKTTIDTAATTLAELKEDMNKAGINFEGMAFYEGVSKTSLVNDEAILPSNLPFKGTITNNLLIMLTVKDKKITSGAMTRAEAYTAIKNNNLQALCLDVYGKNFTQCSTDNLIELINNNNAAPEVPATEVVSTRAEAYDAIKARGLGDAIKAKYGKSFTNCGTDVLLAFVNGGNTPAKAVAAPKATATKAAPAAKKEAPKPAVAPKESSPFSDTEIAAMQKSVFGK